MTHWQAQADLATQYGHNNSHGHPVRDRKAPASSFHAAMAAVSNWTPTPWLASPACRVRVVSVDYVAFTRGTPSRLATAHPQRQRGAGDVLVHVVGPDDELSVEPTAARQRASIAYLAERARCFCSPAASSTGDPTPAHP